MTRLLLACLLIGMSWLAPADEAQRNRMKTCNAEAAKEELKAEVRRQFMKNCLSAKKNAVEDNKGARPDERPPATKERTPTAQQLRMKTCNAEAKSRALSGEARRQFMKACLAGR